MIRGVKRTALALIAAVLAVMASPTSTTALPNGTRVETYKSGLDFPVDMAWDKGTKKIFFTEKDSGRIRVMVGRTLLGEPCVDLDVNSSGERGALGIALHPAFDRNHYLYVYYTNATPLENRVTRFTVRRNKCINSRPIIHGIASSSGYHNGGQLEFVGNKLFVSTGEVHQPALAQDTSNRLGKILRVNADGSVPDSNPFDNEVWSYGHRNPFGLTHKPGTSLLYETENGPDCDDELNLIRKGRNYGWGRSTYDCDLHGPPTGPNPKAPMKRWVNVIVPTDPVFYRGRLSAMSGSLYVGAHGDGRLHRIILNDNDTRVREDRVIHTAPNGITDVAKGPGGWLYFMTSNAIYRIVRT